MKPSSADTHYVTLGRDLTACGEPAFGKGGVLFRSDNPANVTCQQCRKFAGLKGKVNKAARQVAAAGRTIDKAIADYGGIGLYHGKKKRR